jgi:hypothetical protein
MTDEQFRFVNTLLQKSLKQVPATYEHNTNRTWKGQPYVVRDTMVVYKIDKNNGNNLNVKPSNKGWYSLEDMDGVPTRWMRDDATLLLGSYEKVPSKLSFRAQSFNRPRTLNIYVDNYSEANVSIFTNWTAFNVPIKLEKSAKILRFHASDGCERPHDISGLNNSDPRCLSLAFQNISIT